jgi:magnesium-transporting ATPase (P-type)
MAIGVNRMAARNTIIRTVPAVETLGSATVICTDKTGTLTRNQMTVTQVYAAGKTYTVTGAGYSPEGDFLLDGSKVDRSIKLCGNTYAAKSSFKDKSLM